MAQVTFKGDAVSTSGDLPAVGSDAPDFALAGGDLSTIDKASLAGKRVILNIFPSIDTPVCASSVRRFNEEAAKLDNTSVLCVSMDLPFATGRFCGAEGIENVTSASGFRSDFGAAYGVRIAGGALDGLYTRAIVVIDEQGKVAHSQLVAEITEEPDYEAALGCLAG